MSHVEYNWFVLPLIKGIAKSEIIVPYTCTYTQKFLPWDDFFVLFITCSRGQNTYLSFCPVLMTYICRAYDRQPWILLQCRVSRAGRAIVIFKFYVQQKNFQLYNYQSRYILIFHNVRMCLPFPSAHTIPFSGRAGHWFAAVWALYLCNGPALSVHEALWVLFRGLQGPWASVPLSTGLWPPSVSLL